MIKANYNPSGYQVVVCDRCGHMIPLKPFESTEWNIFNVFCPLRCGRYGLISKYRMVSGAECPLCNRRIIVLRRHPYTEKMVELLRGQGLVLYKFAPHGGVELLD